MGEHNRPAFAAGLDDGAADADRRPSHRRGFSHPRYARSWMYRRGFARAFLAARAAAALDQDADGPQEPQETIS